MKPDQQINTHSSRHFDWRAARILVVSFLMVTGLTLRFARAVQAAPLPAIIPVNTTADEFNTGTGCSLREAIQAANTNTAFGGCPAGSGADVIILPAGVYQLTIPNGSGSPSNEDANASGDLDIHDSLTITGAGSGSTFIQAGSNTTNGIDKVFGVNPTCMDGVNVTIQDVTIRYGYNSQPHDWVYFSHTGGGLDFCSDRLGDFTLENVVVSDNTNVNGYGGGLNVDTVGNYIGTITISNSTFANNITMTTTGFANGAGVHILSDYPRVVISNCSFIDNSVNPDSQGGGGALYYYPRFGGSLSITNSLFEGNVAAGDGGAVYVHITGT